MDFASEAEQILSEIDSEYTNTTTPIVELISNVTGKGSSAREELDKLCDSADKLSDLEEQFIETHEDSCNRSMEAFSEIIKSFNLLNSKVGNLKSDILRFRDALGSYSQDLRQLFWRKKRNDCVLQILRVAQQIAESDLLTARTSSKNFYQCATILRSYQMLYEQWPMTRTRDGLHVELPSLHKELHTILSTEKISNLISEIEKSLVSSIIGFPDTPDTVESIIQLFESNRVLPGMVVFLFYFVPTNPLFGIPLLGILSLLRTIKNKSMSE